MAGFMRTITFDPSGEVLKELKEGTQKALQRARFSFINFPELNNALQSLARATYRDVIATQERITRSSAFYCGSLLAWRALDISCATPNVSYGALLTTFCEYPGNTQIELLQDPEPTLRRTVTALADTSVGELGEIRKELREKYVPEPHATTSAKLLGQDTELGLCFTALHLISVEQTLTESASTSFERDLASIQRQAEE